MYEAKALVLAEEAEILWSLGGVLYHVNTHTYIDRKKPPPPGGFLIYNVPESRTRRQRTPLKKFYKVLPGGSSSSGFLIREYSK